MQLSHSRWILALATLAALASLTPAASANAKRAVHPLAVTAARNANAQVLNDTAGSTVLAVQFVQTTTTLVPGWAVP